MRTIKLLLLFVIYLIYSCGGGGGGSSLPPHGGGSVSGTTGGNVGSITLSATPSTITVGGTSSISASVLDGNGSSISDGTVVNFSLSPSSAGSITSQATTSNGTATATFTASAVPGTATITATADSVSDNVNVTVSPPATGSIEFDSASPQVIGLRGSGQTETSTIVFAVKDINGDPVVDGTSVDFVMSGPGGGRLPSAGGEYIGDRDDGSPTTASGSTKDGTVSVILNSGTVAGPVIVVATVQGTSMSSASTPISIGGGIPNDAHLTIVTDRWNLEGLGWANIQANISIFMADRFGNFNVLEGTSASFYAESGAIDRSVVTDSTGSASVVFRTQSPIPENVTALGGGICSGGPSSWTSYPSDWESCLLEYVNNVYGISTTAHPRDGWATIMVSTRGEEHFDDSNANGIYDSGESFSDTSQEAFIDVNDNDSRDDGSSDPFEEYVDDDGDTIYDGVNGIWDSDKTIFKDIKLLITGVPFYIKTNPSDGFSVSDSSSQTFTLLIADVNLNPPIGGTTVSVSSSAGKLSGTTSYTFPDVFNRGPIEISFILEDSGQTNETAVITIKVTYKGIDYYEIVSGTIQ